VQNISVGSDNWMLGLAAQNVDGATFAQRFMTASGISRLPE
jgi:hypothetical protein